MKLYTGKGDTGKTGILGKERLSKDHSRIEAYGTIDELNSFIGMTIIKADKEIAPKLQSIQSTLFEIGTELASVEPKGVINKDDIEDLEKLIDQATIETPVLKSFILPGGSESASWFHILRTITRRAERRIVSLSKEIELNQYLVPYINRLSDLFFAWARLENHRKDVNDIEWRSRE